MKQLTKKRKKEKKCKSLKTAKLDLSVHECLQKFTSDETPCIHGFPNLSSPRRFPSMGIKMGLSANHKELLLELSALSVSHAILGSYLY